jgi:hypothetical protein
MVHVVHAQNIRRAIVREAPSLDLSSPPVLAGWSCRTKLGKAKTSCVVCTEHDQIEINEEAPDALVVQPVLQAITMSLDGNYIDRSKMPVEGDESKEEEEEEDDEDDEEDDVVVVKKRN